MIEFWNQWWPAPTALSLLAALVWAVWTYASAVPTEPPSSGSALLASEARWIRWCGWLAGVSGRSLTVKAGPGFHWARLQAEHADTMREVERANRARFAPAALFALTALVLGIAQCAFTLVSLAPVPESPWLVVSLFLAGWSTVPLFVTWTLMRRWWLRRRIFEWAFLQSADDLLRNYEEDRARGRRDAAAQLDAVEESVADRFSRTPLDLPSHADRARRWQSRSARLLAARPEHGDRAAALAWVERCSALIRSRWDRPSLLRRSAATTMTAKAPLPSSVGIRFAASLTVLFVNTALFVIILVAQSPSPRVDVLTDILADPALIAGVTIAALLFQGIASGARAFTRWSTR